MDNTQAQRGMERVKEAIFAAGFTEAGAVGIDGLTYEEEIRRICEGNSCRNYGASWACPPAVGALDACRRQCEQYGHMILFNRKYPLEDPFDYDGMVGALRNFKARVEALDEAIVPWIGKRLMLSNEGCGRCSRCTYPDSPCRFPDRLYPSIEGYGFNIGRLAREAGMHGHFGPGTVTYFGAVLFGSKGK